MLAVQPHALASLSSSVVNFVVMAMRNAATTVRKKSITSSCVDLRLEIPTSTVVMVSSDSASSCAGSSGPVPPKDGEIKVPDSPRQPTMSLPSETPITESATESTSDLASKDGICKSGMGAKARRGSATMRSFLQRVMRTQSDSHIRIAPIASGDVNQATPCVNEASACRSAVSFGKSNETRANDREEEEQEDEDDDDEQGVSTRTFADHDLADVQVAATTEHRPRGCASDEAVGLCDVFLNSSLQLLQVQSDAKQRVRQLWTCAQRLRWENQLSDSGLESLHQELLAVMKALTVEKLEGPRHIKAGYLTLVQAPPAVIAANLMQRGVAAATKSMLLGNGAKTSLDQRMWISLSEEQCRMELVPSSAARAEQRPPMMPSTQRSTPSQAASDANGLPAMNGAATFPGIGKFKLPTSISWLLSDPMQSQSKDDDTDIIGRTSIKLQGCQVRRMPTTGLTEPNGQEPPRVRFQVLVPNSESSGSAPSIAAAAGSLAASTVVAPDHNTTGSYGTYVFEIPVLDSSSVVFAERERDEWMRAIDRVCVSHLYALENQLREACYMLQFRDILATSFPVCVSLTWLRNRLEKIPAATANGTMSAQQQANYQYQQLQRRSSRNLSMVQIVKDLERDRILVDKKLLISCTGKGSSGSTQETSPRSAGSPSDGTNIVEHDSVAEIVKYLVSKAMSFARNSTHTKPSRATQQDGKPPVATSSSSDVLGLMSPSSRLSKFTEARALAFVERVLRGSSRTQSGGDIYDAISFFCQQRNLMICPMSHDAHPVQLNVVEDHEADDENERGFHVEIEVSMQFKVVEMPSMTPRFDDADPDPLAMASPREWAVLEGTLRRQFTLGKLSEPGSVTVKYIPDPDQAVQNP